MTEVKYVDNKGNLIRGYFIHDNERLVIPRVGESVCFTKGIPGKKDSFTGGCIVYPDARPVTDVIYGENLIGYQLIIIVLG